MPLPESSLSTVCVSVVETVRTELQSALNGISVTVGAPSADSPDPSLHRLNLFFYRFEPGGFDSDVYPNDPWRIRMFCLITALGVDEGAISAGENDLRLLGEVMRVFHSMPLLEPVTLGSAQVRLQTIFTALTEDQINQIWSTQGETTYRPSVAYEMALTPIMPAQLRVEPTLVGAIGSTVHSHLRHRHSVFSGSTYGPPTPFTSIDATDPMWSLAICWVVGNLCEQTINLDTDELATFTPQLWVAGDPGATVELIWETWDQSGWGSGGSPVSVDAFSTAIDPDNIPNPIPGTFPETISVPISLPDDQNAVQGLLYAQRNVATGASTATVRSNPLLISVYRVRP